MGRGRRTAQLPISSKEVSEENQETEWEIPPSQYILNLPFHLIMDILSRLPMKTLLSCGCVFKTCHNLLSDPQFAQLHLERSPVSLLLKTEYAIRESRMLHLCDLEGANTGNRDAKLKLTTRGEYIALPNVGRVVNCAHGAGAGLGFRHETNQYKVIRVSVVKGLDLYEAEIYTLGEGTWRNIGIVPYSIGDFLPFNTFLNGALHWVVKGCKSPDYIHSFHFGSEVFRAIPAPAPLGPRQKEFVNFMTLENWEVVFMCAIVLLMIM